MAPSTTGSGVRRRVLAVVIGTVLGVIVGTTIVRLTDRPNPKATAPTTRITVANADTSVDASTPETNRGTEPSVVADAAPQRIIYLRFEVPEQDGPVNTATLRLRVRGDQDAASPSAGNAVRVDDTTWSEHDLTWRTRPELGEVVFTAGEATPGDWIDFDVTALVERAGAVSIAITSNDADGVFYSTREAGSTSAPRLVVTSGGPTTTTRTADGTITLLAAGDVAGCAWDYDEQTAQILDRFPNDTPIAVLGDTVQVKGAPDEYTDCFEPTWGRHKDQLRTTIGNHEYLTDDGGPYWDYFGDAGGERGQGFYSYELGDWHVVVLNGNCWKAGVGCGLDTPQLDWLDADLAAAAAADRRCTLAFFHQPYFSSIERNDDLATIWDVLYRHGVDLVLNGHKHGYERFAPQRPDGTLDEDRGIREIVVGTGGSPEFYPYGEILPNSEIHATELHGVLRLDLAPTSYTWEFLPTPGVDFEDHGAATCSP